MLIFLIPCLIIIIFAQYKFKQAFIFYMAFKIIALSTMCIRYTPPALSMETFLNVYFLFEFYRKGYLLKIIKRISHFPLKVFFSISIVSIVISSIFSIIPLEKLYTGTIIRIINDFIITILFWFYIRKIADIKQFIYCCFIVFGAACIFGIYEFISDSNPYVDFLHQNVNSDLLDGKIYATSERLGMRRVLSLFVSPNNFLYGAFIILMAYTYNKHIKSQIKYFIPFVFLCLALILLANSRTVLISSIVVILPLFISFKNHNTKKILLISIFILLAASPFLEQYMVNITSVLSTSEKKAIEGSSVFGRMLQFAGSIELWFKSPIIGNGIQSISHFVSEKGGWRYIILGTESIWMKLMIEQGLLGLLAYLTLFWEMNKRFHIIKNKILFFCTLGYLVAHTMSSLPGFSVSFFYITIFCLYRITSITKKNNENRNYHPA